MTDEETRATWDVTIDAEAALPVTEDMVEELLSMIAPYGGAVSYRHTHLSLSLTVAAGDADRVLPTVVARARRIMALGTITVGWQAHTTEGRGT